MSTLHDQLHHLAAHLRDPAAHPAPPDIDTRRLAVYRELLLNNLDGLLAGNFPVIRQTLRDADWHTLIRRFLAQHHCHTPLFTRIGREFVAFLEAEPSAVRPWLAELAHYEWAELDLQLREDTAPPHDPTGDLLTGTPVLSPLAWPLAYRWPVHRIGPDFQPDTPPPASTQLLLRRDAEGHVQFSTLSPLLYLLLERIGHNTHLDGQELLRQLANDAGHSDHAQFLHEAVPMLAQLRDTGIVLGTLC